jgi:3-phenylpropionate/cinnamic acid dioxygenase small subunit
MAGRPSTYDFELCKEVCYRVRNGEHIRDILESEDKYPDTHTWYNWLVKYDELFTLYHTCRKDKAEAQEREYMNIIADAKAGKIDAHMAKVLIDANRWLMQVYNNKLFGNKQIISEGDEVSSISIVINKKEV